MAHRSVLMFWLGTATATVSGVLFSLTLFFRDWIEILFRIEPDHHSGAVEVVILFASATITAASIAFARREWAHRECVPVAMRT